MKRPPFLKLEDQVVIVSPSGNIDSVHVNNTVNILQEWGLKVSISENALQETGRFSGFVEQRLHDLQSAMDNPEVKLIFCSRGGYGAAHLLDKLNFSAIKDNPKWLVGFSDITALHSAFQRQGIMSIHGPMAKHFSEEGGANLSVLYTKAALSGDDLNYTVPVEYPFLNRLGRATGVLFGGQFTEYEEDNKMYGSLYESILSAVQEYDFPVCFGFPVGHTRINLPIVMGGKATLTIKKDTVLLKQRY